jgi:hypothetical protein
VGADRRRGIARHTPHALGLQPVDHDGCLAFKTVLLSQIAMVAALSESEFRARRSVRTARASPTLIMLNIERALAPRRAFTARSGSTALEKMGG